MLAAPIPSTRLTRKRFKRYLADHSQRNFFATTSHDSSFHIARYLNFAYREIGEQSGCVHRIDMVIDTNDRANEEINEGIVSSQ